MSIESIQAKTELWSQRLSGQILVPDPDSPRNTFAHEELPASHRICPPGTLLTRDFDEDRINIFTDEEGLVSHVTFG